MKRFEGTLICSDLDGTLLRNDNSISQDDLKAIEYYKANGGLFTFTTRRSIIRTAKRRLRELSSISGLNSARNRKRSSAENTARNGRSATSPITPSTTRRTPSCTSSTRRWRTKKQRCCSAAVWANISTTIWTR